MKETKEKLFDSWAYKSLPDSEKEKIINLISKVEDIKSLDDDSWYSIYDLIQHFHHHEMRINHFVLEMCCQVCLRHAADLFFGNDWKPLDSFMKKDLMFKGLYDDVSDSPIYHVRKRRFNRLWRKYGNCR